MDRKRAIIGVLSVVSLMMASSTIMFLIAYQGATDNVESLNNTVNSQDEQIKNLTSELESTVNSKNQEIARLETDISDLQTDNEKLNQQLHQPMLWASAPTWYKTSSGEYAFSLNVYNFGDNTANSVSGDIRIFEESGDEEPKETVAIDIGNIAGNSYKNVEYQLDLDIGRSEDDTASAVIRSCRDCLILNERIPSLEN